MKTAVSLANKQTALFRSREIRLSAYQDIGRIRIALIYPNLYWLGMSNLGVHTLFGLLNDQPDIGCERFFWEPRRGQLLNIDSDRSLAAFAVVAFSVSYEPDAVQAARILDSVGLRRSPEQRSLMPLIIGGGAVTYANPRLLAGVCDAVFCGEAEPALRQCAPLLREFLPLRRPAAKAALLAALAAVPGVYVWGVSAAPPSPCHVPQLTAADSVSRIITPLTEFSGCALIEISRGCPWQCDFCLSGARCGAYRQLPVAAVMDYLRQVSSVTDKIGLVAAAVSDYTSLDVILTAVREQQLKLSVSSLRVETVGTELLTTLAQSGQNTVTFAPEAGNERLRHAIGKRITDRQLFDKIELARRCGMKRLKLYFMIGLPTEHDDDMTDICALAEQAGAIMPVRLTVGIFVPKPFTRLAAAAFCSRSVISRRVHLLHHRCAGQASIELSCADYATARTDWRLTRADELALLGADYVSA